MRYQEGRVGRVFALQFDDGDEILEGIADLARKEDIRAAVFYLVGGVRAGKIVVGPERDELPPSPVWKEISESHETMGIGTIFRHGDEPKIHFHGAYGKHDMVKMGCLRGFAETFIIMEAILFEVTGITAERELDPLSGMVLLRINE